MKKLGGIGAIFLFCCSLLFCIIFFSPNPVTPTVQITTEEFNNFYHAAMQILSFVPENSLQTFSSETTETDNPYKFCRLLLQTNDAIDDCGAVMTAVYQDLHIHQYANVTDTQNAFEFYQNLPNVAWVCPDFTVTANEDVNLNLQPQMLNNNSFSYETWGANATGIDIYNEYLYKSVAHKNINNLPEVIVVVADSGIDTSHSWFTKDDRVLFDLGCDFTNSDSTTEYDFEDVHGHGTHVAGTIVDLTLPNVKILPLKVLDNQGKGTGTSVIAALYYIRELLTAAPTTNIVAVNMSLGTESTPVGSTPYFSYNAGVNYLYNNYGILCVVAAGNEKDNVANHSPANVTNAITVGNIERIYSGYNGYTDIYTYELYETSNTGKFVDIAAPGTDIYSAQMGGWICRKTGTSMATPHVTAAVALLYSDTSKNYNIKTVEQTLKAYATDLGPEGVDDSFGAGMLRMDNICSQIVADVEFSNKITNHRHDHQGFDLTLSAAAPIYYTTDNTVPSNTNGIEYTGPIHIDHTTTIKAIAAEYDADNFAIKRSNVVSMQYNFNTYVVNHWIEDKNGPRSENGIKYRLDKTENLLGGDMNNQTLAVAQELTNYAALPFSQKTIDDGNTVIDIFYREIEIIPEVTFNTTPNAQGNNEFYLTLTAVEPQALIIYTADNSEPTIENGIIYTAPIKINRSVIIKAASFVLDDYDFPIKQSAVTTMEYNFSQYIVKHWFENTDNTGDIQQNGIYYCLGTDGIEAILGNPGERTNAVARNVHGFHALPIEQKTIANNTIVDIYYQRNSYTITIEQSSGISYFKINAISTKTAQCKFGSQVTVQAFENPEYTWQNWTANIPGLISNNQKTTTFIMPDSNVILTPQAKLLNCSVIFTEAAKNFGEFTCVSHQNYENLDGGAEVTILITPVDGYGVKYVSVNNERVKINNNQFTFTVKQKNNQIDVEYFEIQAMHDESELIMHIVIYVVSGVVTALLITIIFVLIHNITKKKKLLNKMIWEEKFNSTKAVHRKKRTNTPEN